MSRPGSSKPQYAPESAPFLWLTLPQGPPRKDDPVGLEQFRHLSGRMDLVFEVESEYLFVGSGLFDYNPTANPREPDLWHTFARRGNQLCVPGTSLKGAIRAIVEAISNSCVSQAGQKERVPAHVQRCPENANKVCVSCSLFGRTGWRGRVHFADALSVKEIPTQKVKISDLWPPRRVQGRKFYVGNHLQQLPNPGPEKNHRFVEAVPKGSRFLTSLYFENVKPEELGLVCLALGWDVSEQGQLQIAMRPKIGGAKPRCFGMVAFQAPKLRLWTVEQGKLRIHQKEITGPEALTFVADCIKRCKQSSLFAEDQWRKLIEGLNRPVSCPKGAYR